MSPSASSSSSSASNAASNPLTLVVTGGAGFIGSHLVDRFVGLGHDVHVLDDLSSGRKENLPEGVHLHVHDVRSGEAKAAMQRIAPHVICHQAAQMDVRKSVADPAFDADVNLVGLLNVLEGARSGGRLDHVLFAGSGGAMYGEQDVFPAGEDHPVRPASPYGLAKAVSEQYLAVYERLHGVTWTSLRYANVYGPRQNPHGEAGVVAIFSQRMLAGQPVTIFGDGSQTRDYVFVGDVAEANVQALNRRLHGGFNVGTGVETSVIALERAIRDEIGAKGEPIFAPARPGEQHRSVISADKLAQATGFRPSTPFADGVAQTVAFFREQAAAK